MNAKEPNFAELMRMHGIPPKKSLGQNFLFDSNIINQIIDQAGIINESTVLEIGAGPGNLTRALANHAKRVVAVELDQRFLPLLNQTLSTHNNIEFISANILELDLDAVMGAAGYIVVANLPYYITSAVIRKLLETRQKPTRLVLTVQKEVARRICAKAGALSLLAVSVRIYGDPQLIFSIPAGAFYPVPKVDSAVVIINTHSQPMLVAEELRPFFRVVKAGFSQKRKMLHNALSAGLHLPQPICDQALKSAGIDPSRRAQTLEIAEWLELSRELSRQNHHLEA